MRSLPVRGEGFESFGVAARGIVASGVVAASFGRAGTLAAVEHCSIGIAKQNPQMAGAPVAGDEARLLHQ